MTEKRNFYFKLKDLKLHHLLNFNFSKFARMLASGSKIVQALYSFGYLLKSDNQFHEKEDLCDRIILVSSDTDLLPAIKKARGKGKTVEYIGFSHKPSVAMVANCSKSRLLTKEDLLPFIELKS